MRRMSRPLRSGLILTLCLPFAAVPVSAQQPPAAERPEPGHGQIHWQRTLEDALALSESEKRPLFVAVNMDGESASERIVRERYRDPDFVDWTRPFVCVVASAFRHATRDHDEEGRRIPCPRLGDVTCGEHIALEPILFEEFLGGDRIAPRHAVVLPDGTKRFDLFQLFDLRELDRQLAEAAKQAPRPSPRPGSPVPGAEGGFAVLARARDHVGRAALESAMFRLRSEAEVFPALDAISKSGDAGSVEALRLLFQRSPPPSAELLERIAKTAETLRIEARTAEVARERLSSLGAWPGAPGLDGDSGLLNLLGRLDGNSAPSRSLLLAYAALGAEEDAAHAKGRIEPAAAGSPRPDVARWWSALRAGPAFEPGPGKPPPEKRSAEALEGELSDLDHALNERPDDPELLARYGRNSLELAERRMESGGEGALLLLQDADGFLERAWKSDPRDVTWLFDRAKVAFLAGKHELEEQVAIEAAARAQGADRIEALRWVGDAAARMVAARSGGDPLVEVGGIARGGQALMEVAGSPQANETDWISLGSFLGALGMRREELAVLQLGAERLPASTPLRTALNRALWAGGRIDLAAPKAEWIAARHPESADAAWHAGYARILSGEDRRRREDSEGAIADYRKGGAWFRRCAELRPDYRENADHYRALCSLGQGFAHLLADRRAEAAKLLAEAVAIRPAVAQTRDGLDREPVDLLDGALEWRENGRSPVDVAELLVAIEHAAPEDAYWIRAIADSELREALRADGRGEIVEGDRYLRVSIDAARRAQSVANDDESRRTLAQSLTILGERLLARGDLASAVRPLSEAAPLLGETPPAADADAEEWRALAVRMRSLLGDARPIVRPGR